MKCVLILVAMLMAACSANARANDKSNQPSPSRSSTGIEKRQELSPPAAPLRLVQGTRLVVTETNDATIEGEHNHAVMTAEHTITKASKTEIRFDIHNILNSSSGEYFQLPGDAPNQVLPIDADRLAGERGEATDIYVETPVFKGTMHVLYRHDRAEGEIRRWVSVDPVELELKLEDGSRVKVRADYVKSWILLNGTNWGDEGFALSDFNFIPVWIRDTSERPGKTEEIIRVLTGVQQPAAPLRMAKGKSSRSHP